MLFPIIYKYVVYVKIFKTKRYTYARCDGWGEFWKILTRHFCSHRNLKEYSFLNYKAIITDIYTCSGYLAVFK